MAQGKVTDFFEVKKRSSAKRQKVNDDPSSTSLHEKSKVQSYTTVSASRSPRVSKCSAFSGPQSPAFKGRQTLNIQTRSVSRKRKAVEQEDDSPSHSVESNSLSAAPTTVSSNMTAPSAAVTKISAKCNDLSDRKADTHKVEEKFEAADEKSVSIPHVETETAELKSTIPAYKRYKSLAAKIPASLTLPSHYKLLKDMFSCCDMVVSLLYNRSECCTFDKLKKAVQDMLRRKFEAKHLGQIKAVYPDSYEIQQEKSNVENGQRSNDYQMTIQPIIHVDENNRHVSKRKDGHPVFSSSEISKRKETFRMLLFDIMKDHHQSFLRSMKLPIEVDSSKLTRWHHDFLVENVPDIEPASLPVPPEPASQLVTARNVLDAACGKLPSRIEKALKNVAKAAEEGKQLQATRKPCANSSGGIHKSKQVSETIRGLSSSLLERIRAKEALKAEAAMLRDPKTENEIAMLERLPGLIKILRSHFITEKKNALHEDKVIVTLCDSYKSSISQSSVEDHISYMLQIFPNWISRVSVSSGKFIKINKSTEISQLVQQIDEIKKKKQYVKPKC